MSDTQGLPLEAAIVATVAAAVRVGQHTPREREAIRGAIDAVEHWLIAQEEQEVEQEARQR